LHCAVGFKGCLVDANKNARLYEGLIQIAVREEETSRIEVMLVIGARPQFIKCAPLIKEMAKRDGRIDLTILHSGHHYDPRMSAIFFRELRIPKASMNLPAGSGTHAERTCVIMPRLEDRIVCTKPDVVLVADDTNTTPAGALAASKLGVRVAHVDAGLRSGDATMPEEINRKLTDHCASLLLRRQELQYGISRKKVSENKRI